MRRMNTRKKERTRPSLWRHEARPGVSSACLGAEIPYSQTKRAICSLPSTAHKCSPTASRPRLQRQEPSLWSPERAVVGGLDASTSSIRLSCNATSLAVGVINTAPVALRTQRRAMKRRASGTEQSSLRRSLLSRGTTLARRHRAAPRHSCRPRRPRSTARRRLLGWPASLRSHGRSGSPASVQHCHCAC